MKKLYIKYQEPIMYLIFGTFTTLVGFLSYYLLTIKILNPNNSIQLQIANIISWLASVIFAYITNRKYVFKSQNKHKLKELSKFITVRIITLIMDMIIMAIGVSLFKLNDKIIKIISEVIIIISNYLFSKLVVFKRKWNNVKNIIYSNTYV